MGPNPRLTMCLKLLAWGFLAVIVFATIVPIGLRPTTQFSPNIERFAAFAVTGLVFVLAYPRRWVLVLALLVLTAGALEAMQLMEASRHGRMRDVLFKIAGGGFGVAMGCFLTRLRYLLLK